MTHHLKISISTQPQAGGIVRCRNVCLLEQLLCRLLGEKQKLMILIPRDSVELKSIKEIDKGGGSTYEQGKAAAGCHS